MNTRASVWLFLIPVLIVAACGRQPARLTEQEKQNVSELTQNLKTRCVGRYLIDVPADVLVSGGATVEGVKIEPEAMSHEAFLQEVANRKAELSGTKSSDAYPLLYADDQVDVPDTHYFIYRDRGDDPGNRVFEAYKWDHGYRFKLGIEGSDFLHPDQTKDPIVQQITVKNDVPEKTRLVFDLVERLRWRADDEIPTEPGLCFPGAFLPGKAVDKEDVGAQFVLAGNRDVSIGIGSNSGIREANTLLQRGDEIDRDLKAIGGRTIRKGTVALQRMTAEEWLFVGKSEWGVMITRCLIEANSMTSSAQSPLVTLDLSTGSPNAFLNGPVRATSMSESEAVVLWDIVSRALRPRPNGF
jgi:hypothetical protein